MSDHFLHYGTNLRVVPCIHARIGFSILVNHGLAEDGWRPDVVAIELPPSIGETVANNMHHVGVGPLWVGKRVKEYLETFPASLLTGYQHTPRACRATTQVLLDARRFARDRLKIAPACAMED